MLRLLIITVTLPCLLPAQDTLSAMQRYLTAHQKADGHWEGGVPKDQDRGASCTKVSGAVQRNLRATALALLAQRLEFYRGATPRPEADKEVVDSVVRASQWLMQRQTKAGSFGDVTEPYGLEDHALVTVSLARAYFVLEQPRLREVVQEGIDYAFQRALSKTEQPSPFAISWLVYLRGYAMNTEHDDWKYDESYEKVFRSWLKGRAEADTASLLDNAAELLVRVVVRLNANRNAQEKAEAYAKQEALAQRILAIEPFSDTTSGPDPRILMVATAALFQFGGRSNKKWRKCQLLPLLLAPLESGQHDGSHAPPTDAWSRETGRLGFTAVVFYSIRGYYLYTLSDWHR